MRPLAGLVIAAVLAPACARHLPDQDLRILTTPPAAKLSTEDLWKDFQKDPAAARRQYFGTAMDVSGKIFSIDAKVPTILFSETDRPGVRGKLLDERAAEIVKGAVISTRITLRCFCEGLDEHQNVLLKSCIRP